MTGLRIWVPSVVLATVLILVGAFVVGVQPQLDAAAAAGQTSSTVESTNQAARIRIIALTKQAAKTESMQAEDVELRKAVPTVLKPNRFVRRVSQVAALDGVTVTGVTPGTASGYAPAPSLARGGGSVAPVAGALALGKTDPSITAANLTYVPMTVTVTGAYDATISFAHDLQDGERLFAISSLQTSTDDKALTTATLAGAIYTLKR